MSNTWECSPTQCHNIPLCTNCLWSVYQIIQALTESERYPYHNLISFFSENRKKRAVRFVRTPTAALKKGLLVSIPLRTIEVLKVSIPLQKMVTGASCIIKLKNDLYQALTLFLTGKSYIIIVYIRFC